MARLIVIEIGKPIFPRVCSVLDGSGHDLEAYDSVGTALTTERTRPPDLLLLDVAPSSLAVAAEACRMVRSSLALSRTLLLVAYSALTTAGEQRLFDAGADDCIPRRRIPRTSFHARLAALLRRGAPGSMGARLQIGPLCLDLERGDARLDGRALDLTPKQFAVLCRLARDAGRPVSRADLLEGLETVVDANVSRAVDMHVRQIRRKLGGAADLIESHYGCGYALRVVDDEQAARKSG